MPIETGRFVELQRRLILATGHQHHLVAAHGPGRVERFGQQGFRAPSAAVRRMRHHVFDHAIGPAAAREVGDHGQVAAGDQFGALESTEVVKVTTCQDFLPDRIDDKRGGKGVVRRVKVLVEIEQRWQVGFEELAGFHVLRGQWAEYLTARGPCSRFSPVHPHQASTTPPWRSARSRHEPPAPCPLTQAPGECTLGEALARRPAAAPNKCPGRPPIDS
ncbi:unnamed protein product [Brugia timori]|uniref:Transposase n=1 Tax=Brugia timori TaxID=42155 RepID=A0A0R3QGK3_9BILA|nr:unnamed protein product [Brugia timori]